MFYRHSLIQRPKATVIIFGLLATLAIPLYGHSPPPAESCKGWECDNPGQLCGPGVPGAGTVRYICTEEGKWELFPHLPHPEHISVLTHHGHIHPEDLDAEVAAATADMEAAVAAAAERKYTQADLDAQVAQSQCVATLAPEELPKVTCSDLQTYLNAYDDVSIYTHDHCGRKGIRLSTAWQSDEKDLYDVTCSSLTTYFHNLDAVSNHYKVNCGGSVPVYTQAEYDAAKEGMVTQAQYDAAKEGMFTQAEVNVKVEEAVEAAAKGMYTQEQLNESVRDATAGMDTEDESIEGAPSEHDRIFVYDGLCEEYNDELEHLFSPGHMGRYESIAGGVVERTIHTWSSVYGSVYKGEVGGHNLCLYISPHERGMELWIYRVSKS